MTIAAIAEANGPWGMRPTPPRRVLIFTTSLGSGGTERVAVNLARWLRDAGHEVCVLTLAETAEDFYTVPDRVERRSLALTGASANPAAALFANARRLAGIRECAMQFRADVVVSLGDQMNVLALLALTGMRCRKIISERSDPARKPMSRGWNLLRSITYARADLHIAQSRYVADWIGARFPRLPSQVIGNAVDLRGDRSAKRQITRTDPAPQILAVGRLTKEKGFDVLLRALAHVRSELRGARLTILGDEPLLEMVRSSGGVPVLLLHSRDAGPYVIESSTNLEPPWATWTNITFNLSPLPANSGFPTDAARFFRARR